MIADDAIPTGATQTVMLQGTGSAAAPAFTVSTESLVFPDQQVNTTSVARAVKLTNNSGATVSLTAPAYSAGFKGTSCGATLANGASCTLQVQFAPTQIGSTSGTLTIPITGKPSLTVNLYGLGTPSGMGSLVTVNPSSITFSPLVVGDDITQVVTISNTLGLPSGIRSIVLSGDAGFSMGTNTCSSMLPGTASCGATVMFVASAIGTFNATLTITESSGAVTVVPITAYVGSGT